MRSHTLLLAALTLMTAACDEKDDSSSFTPSSNLDCLEATPVNVSGADDATLDALCEGGAVTIDGDLDYVDAVDMNRFACACEVSGTLTIQGSTGLSGLSNLQRVGALTVADNPELVTLNGLQQLTEITGALTVRDNGIQSLAGLENLTTVSAVDLSGNTALEDYSALSGLTASPGALTLSGHVGASLPDFMDGMLLEGSVSVSACETLTSLTGLTVSPDMTGDLSLSNLPLLTDLSALESLATVGGSLALSQVDTLTSLSSLAALTAVGGDLSIEAAPLLPDLSGLEALTGVGGVLSLSSADLIVDLTGLTGLTSTGGIALHDNPVLYNLEGADLDTISGGATFAGNTLLRSLDGLESVGSLGALEITDNAVIWRLDALQGLSGIDGAVTITNNPQLSDDEINALLDAVGEFNIGGDVTVEGNGG